MAVASEDALAPQPRPTGRGDVVALQRTVTPDAGFTTGTLHWQVAYDPAGNVTQVTEPKGDVRVSTYGALNRLDTTTSEHDGLGRLWREHRYDGM